MSLLSPISSPNRWRRAPAQTALPDKIGEYKVKGRLGEGSFGLVLRVEKGGRDYAMKILRSRAAAYFGVIQEGNTLKTVEHPNTLKVIEVNGDYMVTEFVNGISLKEKLEDGRERIKKEGSFIPEALAILEQAARALWFAYEEKGIIHRDIKPSSLMLQEGAGERMVKVIDWGANSSPLYFKEEFTEDFPLAGFYEEIRRLGFEVEPSVDSINEKILKKTDLWEVYYGRHSIALMGNVPLQSDLARLLGETAEYRGEDFGSLTYAQKNKILMLNRLLLGSICPSSPVNPRVRVDRNVFTREYAAPEQLEGPFTDHRGDIFSLGLVGRELLTGEKVFRALGDSRYDREKVAENVRILPAIDSLLAKMTEDDVEKRCASYAEIFTGLEAIRAEIKQVTDALQEFFDVLGGRGI